jgi:hypothetical protein
MRQEPQGRICKSDLLRFSKKGQTVRKWWLFGADEGK